jgi:membrane-associated progesterone receptor component
MNEDTQSQHNAIMNEIYHTINLLYYSINIETKNSLLQRLEEQISRLTWLFNQVFLNPQISAEGVQAVPVQGIVISPSELSKYDGKNGNPAYVAINGIVYDVTNNAAWAAASHFGLSAGRDLTGAHASCHANQDVLSKLKVVGRLNDGVTQL